MRSKRHFPVAMRAHRLYTRHEFLEQSALRDAAGLLLLGHGSPLARTADVRPLP
jgi:hypothetical protein